VKWHQSTTSVKSFRTCVCAADGLFFGFETRFIGLHFAANGIDLSSFKFFWWASKNYFISARVRFQPFKVIQGHWFWHQSY